MPYEMNLQDEILQRVKEAVIWGLVIWAVFKLVVNVIGIL